MLPLHSFIQAQLDTQKEKKIRRWGYSWSRGRRGINRGLFTPIYSKKELQASHDKAVKDTQNLIDAAIVEGVKSVDPMPPWEEQHHQLRLMNAEGPIDRKKRKTVSHELTLLKITPAKRRKAAL